MNEDYIERIWEEAKLLFLEGGEDLIPTLITLAYSGGMDAEREACAKICDGYAQYGDSITNWAVDCAAAIRAREIK